MVLYGVILKSEPKHKTVAGEVALKATYKTPIFLSPKAAILIKVYLHENLTMISSCMTSKRIIGMYPSRFFHIINVNSGNLDQDFHENRKIGEITTTPEKSLYVEYERYVYFSNANESTSHSSENAETCKRASSY